MGNYSTGHALGEGSEHPVHVEGVIANVNAAAFTFGGEVAITNVPLDVNVASGTLDVNIRSVTSGTELDVVLQDSTSDSLDIRFHTNTGSMTLASGVVMDAQTMTLVAGHGVATGDFICIKEGARVFNSMVQNVDTNVITLDSPFDYAFTTAAHLHKGNIHMNVNASGASPVIYSVGPGGLSGSISWHITSISMHIEDNLAMDDTKFGGISALTNGFVLRKHDGVSKNIMTIKDNGDLMDYCQIAQYNEKASTGYGIRAVKLFGGQENTGSVIQLDSATNDTLQIIIRDDLRGLTDMHVLAIGHVVTN